MKEVYVKTPARLHFTLIDLNGSLSRVDGGIGVAIDRPNVVVKASLSDRQEVYGLRKDSAEAVLRKVVEAFNIESGVRVEVLEAIPEHVGLGSKTQLSLAVAKAVSSLFGLNCDVRRLASITGRGGTSGIGVAAFERGGFILDGGHSFGKGKDKEKFLPSSASSAPPAPVLVRYNMPGKWFFVVGVPNVEKGAHGAKEVKIFEKFCPIPRHEVEAICHLILMKILPAVVERDLSSFGEGLTEIQGLGFKKLEVSLQPPLVKELIDSMIKWGAAGAGMSSFGPAVFGVVEGKRAAESLLSEVETYLSIIGGECFIAKVNNTGAQVFEEAILTLRH
ncbi:MAG: beta-ribofuranosylaminobenzene 5'-phosphate synthase [Candidatus Freyarchaeota archaeon]|nr:beta-ribofuranosylaminobenzene 5'-phosphate synthase [Candidatus Jordarchaeia archaeon]